MEPGEGATEPSGSIRRMIVSWGRRERSIRTHSGVSGEIRSTVSSFAFSLSLQTSSVFTRSFTRCHTRHGTRIPPKVYRCHSQEFRFWGPRGR